MLMYFVNLHLISQVITALGKTWHPEHFCCANCQQELGSKNFFEREGKPYCESCYHNLFSPRCAYCDGPILDVREYFFSLIKYSWPFFSVLSMHSYCELEASCFSIHLDENCVTSYPFHLFVRNASPPSTKTGIPSTSSARNAGTLSERRDSTRRTARPTAEQTTTTCLRPSAGPATTLSWRTIFRHSTPSGIQSASSAG